MVNAMGSRVCARARRGCGLCVEGLEGRIALSVVRHGVAGLRLHDRSPAMTASAPTAVAAPVVAPAPAARPAASNPAGDVVGVTDPSVIAQRGAYYVFSSGPGIPIRRSTDLVHWQQVGQVFAATPAWALAKVPGATSIWAPDISYFGGEYHVYYAVSEYGTNRSVIGLATNTTLDPSSPDYHWVDQGEVIASTPGHSNWNALDPQLAFDSGGEPWLVFGSQWSGIKTARIDASTGKLLGGEAHPALVSLAHRPGSRPIEAPFVVQHDGIYYLFVSFDRCCMGTASTYKIAVGRSSRITGPYVDASGTPMTRGGGTVILQSQGQYRGPGHNAVLTVGSQSWLFYHTYNADDDGIPQLQVRPLVWGSDGWPVVGNPLF